MAHDRLRKILVPLFLTLAVGGFSTWGYLTSPAFLDLLELKSFDLRQVARGSQSPFGYVTVVAIDERSIEKVGRWPWSRKVMAELVRKMDAAGPRVVGYDIGFFDPEDKPAAEELLRLLKNAKALGIRPTPRLKSYFKTRLAATNPDLTLARALAGTKAKHILGYYFRIGSTPSGTVPPIPGAEAYPVQRQVDDGDLPDVLPVPRASGLRGNIPLLAKAAGHQASFNVVPDFDGTIRRYNLVFEYAGAYYQPLAAAMFSSAVPEGLPTLQVTQNGLVGVQWLQHRAPTDQSGRMTLNYRGPGMTIRHVPAWKVLASEEPLAELADRYVIVGVTAPAVFDMRVTPFDVAYPGVEIHATALDNMLAQDYIRRPGWAPLADIAAIWGLAGLCLVLLWNLRPVFTLAGFAAVAGSFVAVNMYFFEVRQFWLSMVYPMLSFVLNYLTINVYRFMFADRQKKEIRSAFTKYLDPNVVEQVVRDPDKLALGGERLDLTVLFSDIRSFTGFSEKMPPEELVGVLNEYFTAMTEAVLAHKGLLDKYIGDAVMAVFGAPYPYEDHAEAACRTALDMMRRLDEFNGQLQERGYRPLEIGVGIHTGGMVAGNMGSDRRLSYTVMGEGVNLASRLEGLTKHYRTPIIISRDTQERVGAMFWTRTVDIVRPKGAAEKVELFQLLAAIEEPRPLDYMGDYIKMVEAYREGAFDEALEMVKELSARHPEDALVGVYVERLEFLAKNPPDEWDCVFNWEEK